MNAAYAQLGSSICHRNNSRQDATFRSSTAAPYSSTHSMSIQPQSHLSTSYAGSYIPLGSSRTSIQDSIHSSADVLAPQPSGGQPPTSEPTPSSCHHNGKKYQLVVVQQPQRARMCGFGDKTKRYRAWNVCAECRSLVCRWKIGGQPDTSPNGTYHLPNGVKSEPGQASYSNPYSTSDSTPNNSYNTQIQNYNGQPSYSQNYGQPNNQSYTLSNGYSQPPTPQQIYFAGQGIHAASSPSTQYADPTQGQLSPYTGRTFTSQDSNHRVPSTNPSQGMFTRNLIGSLAASAFRLTDPEDKIGIWFVLQDLSVRTEGDFRLRFSFVNVSEISPPSGAMNGTTNPPLTKRFPGVVESTPLSRCFATQGIKIPIRKDAAKGDKEKDDDDD